MEELIVFFYLYIYCFLYLVFVWAASSSSGHFTLLSIPLFRGGSKWKQILIPHTFNILTLFLLFSWIIAGFDKVMMWALYNWGELKKGEYAWFVHL